MKHFPALWALYVQDREDFNWTLGHIVLLTYDIKKWGRGVKNVSVWFSPAIDTLYRYAVSSVGEHRPREVLKWRNVSELFPAELRDRA